MFSQAVAERSCILKANFLLANLLEYKMERGASCARKVDILVYSSGLVKLRYSFHVIQVRQEIFIKVLVASNYSFLLDVVHDFFLPQ